LHSIETHTTTAASMESSPWWINSSIFPGNYLKQCTLTSCTLSVVVYQLDIDPLTICMDPRWTTLGKCTPTDVENFSLVIPPSKWANKGLKLSALGSFEMGWKDFLGSDLMISQEFQMCPTQLSHPQWLSNAPKMISSLESDGKLGNRCASPSSQLG
jgi:hypothetical protein